MIKLSDVLERLLWIARALGFVFLVYFVPVVVRDLAGAALPGEGLAGLFLGDSADPWAPLLVSVATFAISVIFVVLYAHAGPDAIRPRRLLRFDRDWFAEWGRGLLLGVGVASLAVLPSVMTGAIRIEGISGHLFQRPDLVLATFLVIVIEGAREEFGFRGPAQRDLTAAVGFPLAAIFLAGSFAIIHGGNPDVGRRGLLGILFAGMALAGLVRARGDLGMASGLHAGWNVCVGMVWSVPVSGYRLDSSLLDVESPGSVSWTGGTFGVEGSVPGIVVLALLGFFTWKLSERTGGATADEATDPEVDSV
jgi:membrane protease YdiL (CAAX protease family)